MHVPNNLHESRAITIYSPYTSIDQISELKMIFVTNSPVGTQLTEHITGSFPFCCSHTYI